MKKIDPITRVELVSLNTFVSQIMNNWLRGLETNLDALPYPRTTAAINLSIGCVARSSSSIRNEAISILSWDDITIISDDSLFRIRHDGD
jgi:hypothetical protein